MICCLLSTALRTGFVLCIAGLSTVSIVLLLVPLVADQACDLQPMATQKPPDVLNNLQGAGDCKEVVIAGFLTILSVPGTLLLLVGFFIVIMAGNNRISYKRLGYRIRNDWR
jgi:disulfide bond formation protein DsbB